MCSFQWFGDYVTPATWGHLWLAEGLTTYLDNINADVNRIRVCPTVGHAKSQADSHTDDVMIFSMQWFGDFVTPATWGHLWLAEGLATYFENVGADAGLPAAAPALDRFFADSLTAALEHDVLGIADSRPLAVTAGRRYRCPQNLNPYPGPSAPSLSPHVSSPTAEMT